MTGLVESDSAVTREHLPHRLDDGIASRAAIGLIVLATDQTMEHEFRRLLDLPGVGFYESRILNEAAITPATLAAMEARLADATEVILPGLPLDVIAFGLLRHDRQRLMTPAESPAKVGSPADHATNSASPARSDHARRTRRRS